MARRSSIPPALRELLDQAKAAKREQHAALKPLREHRRVLAEKVHRAQHEIKRAQDRLAALTAPPVLPGYVGLFPWRHAQDVATAESAIIDAERALVEHQQTLDTYDLLHLELQHG